MWKTFSYANWSAQNSLCDFFCSYYDDKLVQQGFEVMVALMSLWITLLHYHAERFISRQGQTFLDWCQLITSHIEDIISSEIEEYHSEKALERLGEDGC